jgi:Heterokaryon incompatibility protein (HET)
MDGLPAYLYRYQPLDHDQQQIRVLKLLAGKRQDAIRGELIPTSLSSATRLSYETISYVWGDPIRTAWLDISGQVLPVPFNTASALRRMRRADHERVVWIDAICINQDDHDERGQQVSLMGLVYSSASGNLIHLGDCERTAERILRAVHLLDGEARGATNGYRNFAAAVRTSDTGEYKYTASKVQRDLDWDAVRDLISVPWFR